MFVTDGAQAQLLKDERQRFVETEWPKVLATIDRLGLDAQTLLKEIKDSDDPGDKEE